MTTYSRLPLKNGMKPAIIKVFGEGGPVLLYNTYDDKTGKVLFAPEKAPQGDRIGHLNALLRIVRKSVAAKYDVIGIGLAEEAENNER